MDLIQYDDGFLGQAVEEGLGIREAAADGWQITVYADSIAEHFCQSGFTDPADS